MLVYTPFALCFLHFVAFLCISGTNLLTRLHSASSLFSAVFMFQKGTQEIFSELDETKAEPPIFPDMSQSPKMRRRRARGRPHPKAARPSPGPRHQGVRPPGPPPDAALPPIYSPRQEKSKAPINFPWNLLQAAAVIDVRLGGSRSSSRHPAGEGNHHRRPSSSPWLPPEWCVISLPWTTGP
jgi:hypothetical protein